MDQLQPSAPQTFAPLPYKNRRGWLIGFGIVQILIACFFLLMTAIMAFGVASLPKMSPGRPALPTAMLYVAALMYLGVAALFIVTGIGSIRAKNWARITILVISWLWLVTGVFCVLISVLIVPAIMRQSQAIMEQQPGHHPLPDNYASIAITIIVVTQTVTMILLPLVFILFYSNKNVRATCLGTAVALPSYGVTPFVTTAVSAPPQRTLPLPILILVIWFTFSALSCAVTALWIPVAGVMGYVLYGAAAHALLAVFALIAAYCAWSFYKLRIGGWWTAVVWYGFSILSGLISAFTLDPLAIQRQAGFMTPESEKIFQVLPHFFTAIQFVSVVITLGFFILLLTTRRYFPRATQ